MSDPIIVSIISGCATIGAIVVGRIISHFEHKKTETTINRIELRLNGDLDVRIKNAVEAAIKIK